MLASYLMQKMPHCGFCGVTASEHILMKCSGCLNMYYCGKEHQRFDWKKHKPTCRMQQSIKPHMLGRSDDSQLGTSIPSERSMFDSNPQIDSRIGSMSSISEFPIAMPVPIFPGRPSVIQATGKPKQECLSLTTIPERRKTYGMGELCNTYPRMERKTSIDPQNPPKRYEMPHLDFEQSFVATPDFFNLIGLSDRIEHTQNRPINLATDFRFRTDNTTSKHAAFVLRIRKIAHFVGSALKRYGWCVLDNFLGSNHATAILNEVSTIYFTPGKFSDGQLVKTREGSSSQDIRSDKIYWFDNRVDQGVNIGFLVSMIDSVVFHLSGNIPPYKINGRSRAMIACYPGSGTKYVKHVDNPDKDGRCITSLYYLNQGWDTESGGVLRLFPERSSCPIDIEPLLDRLIFFWSDRRNPHEVLPSFSMRYAITIWYFDAEERENAIAREQTERQTNADSNECVVFATPSGSVLESRVAKVALNSPPHFSSTDSVNTILSSTGSLPSLQDISRYASRANSLNIHDTSALLDAAAAALSSEEYLARRATLDIGHLSHLFRNRRSPDSSRKFMATVPETKSPDNEPS